MNVWLAIVAMMCAVILLPRIGRFARGFYLREFPLAPGEWFRTYSSEWLRAHGYPPTADRGAVTSAVIPATNGFVWMTATPEFDREWFNRRGFDFPARWLPWSVLDNYQGAPGEVMRLDV